MPLKQVSVSQNLTADMIEDTVRNFSEDEDHSRAQMCVVVVMSHGDNGAIFGVDGRSVDDETLVAMFNNDSAPLLKGRPKLFVFSHCR